MSLYTDPQFWITVGVIVFIIGCIFITLWQAERDGRKDAEELRKAASKQADKDAAQGYRVPYDDQVDRERKAPPNWREK
jgi:FtsZ-interacting cell division protein ZipA